MKAFKLFSATNGDSAFIEGIIPNLQHVKADYFFTQESIERYELTVHRAPRYQLVATLKGKLEFTVTNGTTFTIEPGVLLIANDLNGKGHSWKLIEGDTWSRVYIVLESATEDFFKAKEF